MDMMEEIEQRALMYDPAHQKRLMLMDEALAKLDRAVHPLDAPSPYPDYYDETLLKIIDSVTLE